MPKVTLIARVSNSLILAESMDTDDMEHYRTQAKQICKALSPNSAPRACVEAGAFYYLYLIEKDVCYLTVCDRAYPKKLAINYLDELQKEFDIQYGHEVFSAKRPYAFIKFDTFIQKTKKLYVDTKSQRNLSKVAEELNDVKRIMTQNIQDILVVGEKLQTVTKKSDELLAESALYAKDAKALHMNLLLKKYAPIIITLVIVVFFLYMRYYWW